MQANQLISSEPLSKITDAIRLHLTRQRAYGRSTADSDLMLGLVTDIDVIARQMKEIILVYDRELKAVREKMHSHEVLLNDFMALFNGKSNDIFDPNVSVNIN